MEKLNKPLEMKCKYCGGQNKQTAPVQIKEFCSVACLYRWESENKQPEILDRQGRRMSSRNITITPIFRKEPDIDQLARAFLDVAKEMYLREKQDG